MHLRFLTTLLGSFAFFLQLGHAQVPGNSPAQPTNGQPPVIAPEQQKRIDEVLATWEQDAKALQSLAVTFKVVEENVAFKQKTESLGVAKVLKLPTGTYGMRLEIYELDRAGKPDLTKMKRKYIFSGNWFYEYDPTNKVIRSRAVNAQNLKPDDGPFAFIFGMKALDAKKRFSLSIAQSDQHWTWLKVVPLTDQDRRDFTIAQLGVVNYANAVSPKDFPIRIMWREASNNVQSWEFTEIIRNDFSKVTPMDFSIEEDKRAGWKVQPIPSSGAMQTPNQPNAIVPAGSFVPRK